LRLEGGRLSRPHSFGSPGAIATVAPDFGVSFPPDRAFAITGHAFIDNPTKFIAFLKNLSKVKNYWTS